MTSEESKNIDVNEVVEEITVVLSQHLNRVIKSITNEQNNNINENIKILQTLPLVQNLQKENKELTEKLNALQEKYKNTLEELISLKNETTICKNVTMEISELAQNVIKTNIKDILTPLQIPSLNDWNINMSDDEDYADTFNKLSEEDKNKDATEDEKDAAIQNYKNFYKNHELMGLNALSYSDLLKQVMESSAGIKGWSGAVPEELSAENAREDEDDEKKLINDAIAEYEEGEEDDEEEEDEDDEEEKEEEKEEEDDEDDEEEEEEEDDEEEEEEEDDEDDEEEKEEEKEEEVEEEKEEEDDEEEEEEEDDEDDEEEKEEEKEEEAEEEKEEDADEEEDDEEGSNSTADNTIHKTILLAQNAGEYATIDTASEEEEEDDDSDEIELEELLIKDKLYYTDNKQNGDIYECLSDGEIGDIIGNLENGAVFFS